MKCNMNEDRKIASGNANNVIPNTIKPEMVKDAWNYAAIKKVLETLGMELLTDNCEKILLISIVPVK